MPSLQIDLQVDEAFALLVDSQNLTAVIEATLQREQQMHAALTVVITSDEVVQQLNLDYRGVDAPTDVLSFANQDEPTEESPLTQLALPLELMAEMAAYLGDIIIAYPYAAQQAAHYGNSIAAELRLLAVHGTLHLLGYDHATAEEEAAMWTIQRAVLAPFGDQALTERLYKDEG